MTLDMVRCAVVSSRSPGGEEDIVSLRLKATVVAAEIGNKIHVAFRRIVCLTGKGGIFEIVL